MTHTTAIVSTPSSTTLSAKSPSHLNVTDFHITFCP